MDAMDFGAVLDKNGFTGLDDLKAEDQLAAVMAKVVIVNRALVQADASVLSEETFGGRDLIKRLGEWLEKLRERVAKVARALGAVSYSVTVVGVTISAGVTFSAQ
jgi:hypothetical protein